MKKIFILTSFLWFCCFAYGQDSIVPAQSNRSERDLKNDFNNYVSQIFNAGENVRIDLSERGMQRYSLPIKPEARELCEMVIEFVRRQLS